MNARRIPSTFTYVVACIALLPVRAQAPLDTTTSISSVVSSETAVRAIQTGDANDICSVAVGRLVFTLADLTMQSCMATTSGSVDTRCSSLCWCRAWANVPVTADTLALCVPMNATSSCTATDQHDCRAALEAAATTATTVPVTSPPTVQSDKKAADDHDNHVSGWVYILVGAVCAGVIGGIAFAINWYRNRPVPISAPATVTHGDPSRQAGLPTWTELDVYDDKMPEAKQSTRPSHRPSIQGGQGLMHIDSNASIISGVSGMSYHDLDGTRLGHVNEAHALTETELSLCQDAHERVFSPIGNDSDSDTFVRPSPTDAVTVVPATQFRSDGRSLTQRAMSPLGQNVPSQYDSSFISVASTTYLTNNDTFSSQITMPDSPVSTSASSLASTARLRETEF